MSWDSGQGSGEAASCGQARGLWHASESWPASGSSETTAVVRLTHAVDAGVILGTHFELLDGKECKPAAGADMLLLCIDSWAYKMSVDTRRHSRSRYMMNAIVYWVAQGTGAQK